MIWYVNHGTAWHGMVQYDMVQHDMVWRECDGAPRDLKVVVAGCTPQLQPGVGKKHLIGVLVLTNLTFFGKPFEKQIPSPSNVLKLNISICPTSCKLMLRTDRFDE